MTNRFGDTIGEGVLNAGRELRDVALGKKSIHQVLEDVFATKAERGEVEACSDPGCALAAGHEPPHKPLVALAGGGGDAR